MRMIKEEKTKRNETHALECEMRERGKEGLRRCMFSKGGEKGGRKKERTLENEERI